ncbi:MAG: dihydroorotate dehydrogenase electron transfer subunit [Thermoanaerobaculia bacterium]|nr:dihydroorotate dehydrogenase electron transfer subunit [Thermoanaerobaculia bacterium]
MLPRDLLAEVVEVRAHPLPYFTLVLDVADALAGAAAGQFVMLETTGELEPYLRRAFSIADLAAHGGGARLELLAKIVGRGTRAMSELAPGARRRLLAPLGRGFALPATGPVALVAGGVGSAPLLLLGRQLVTRGVAFDFFYGGRSAADLARADDFAALAAASGGRFVAATEDGSRGVAGRVTAALEAEIAAGRRYREAFACGPMPMLAALARLGAAHELGVQAALETEMGCGFGACLGCAVPHVDGRFALCCKDGPVFRLDEVRW